MLDFLKIITGGAGGGKGDGDAQRRAGELRLATAAILTRAGVIDGAADDAERGKLRQILRAEFDLGDAELETLIGQAESRERDAVDLYQFTRVITRELDQEGRKNLVRLLWEVVFADGVEDPFEANLVWRVAELIGVNSRDRVLLKKEVQQSLGR